jgi:hypothetical protein
VTQDDKVMQDNKELLRFILSLLDDDNVVLRASFTSDPQTTMQQAGVSASDQQAVMTCGWRI